MNRLPHRYEIIEAMKFNQALRNEAVDGAWQWRTKLSQ